MLLLSTSNPDLSIPQTAVWLSEKDPRSTEISEFLDSLRSYTQDSLFRLRIGQVKALDFDFARLEKDLECLGMVSKGWDGYDADKPSKDSIEGTRGLLRSLQRSLITPEKITPSAEGGVALSFKAPRNKRAQIEVLNNGERFAHLYDLDGNSQTFEWSKEDIEKNFEFVLKPVREFAEL